MVSDWEIDGSHHLCSNQCWQFSCKLCVTNLLQPVLLTGCDWPCHVLSCLCDNACERSLATCWKVVHCLPLATGFCLSLYSLHVLNRDVYMIKTNSSNDTKVCDTTHEKAKNNAKSLFYETSLFIDVQYQEECLFDIFCLKVYILTYGFNTCTSISCIM